MRRKDREITKRREIEEILKSVRVCRVAINDDDGIYIVPVNFGYLYNNDTLEIYFHGACEGKKFDLLKDNTSVGFEMDLEYGLEEGAEACDYGFKYASIIGKGRAEVISDADEKADALNVLMVHQTGKIFKFDEKMTEATAVFKITAYEYTGKKYI